jgi:uncharacterized iron-regulated membrane protein
MGTSTSFYMSVWRWHFYAGLYTVPFLLMLAFTGLTMLYAPVIEEWTNSDLYHVEQVSNAPLTYDAQKSLIANAYPSDVIKSIHSSKNSADATRFQVVQNGDAISVFVDPYQGKILGSLSISHSLYAWADDTHGTFMFGDTGDKLIEIAISFTVLLVMTGLYLWWPRGSSTFKKALMLSRTNGRAFWRDLHSVIGVWSSIILLFFCLSGLAWASVWGGSMLQAWSTFPMEKNAGNVSSTITHDALNVSGLKQVPWGLEQAALPESLKVLKHNTLSIDQVIANAKAMGFTQFQLFLPNNEKGVFTASASSMSKDIENATDDRTVHFDQYSGEVLADVGYQDYSLAAKSMAVGISLHMGQWGFWNYVVNTLFCLGIILICITGVTMWWMRRPAGKMALSAPQKPKDMRIWKQATWMILGFSLLFPLGAAAMAVVLIIDRLLLILWPKLRMCFD